MRPYRSSTQKTLPLRYRSTTMMRLLLLLITLGSLAFSAAILPRDDAPVSPNVTVVEEDPDTVYTQETKPGMVNC